MSLEFEKDFDDEVYEDSFYEEDEELEDDESDSVDAVSDSDLDENDQRIDVSLVCDDCDYRWDDTVIQKKNAFGEPEELGDVVCPMCGSMNVTQI